MNLTEVNARERSNPDCALLSAIIADIAKGDRNELLGYIDSTQAVCARAETEDGRKVVAKIFHDRPNGAAAKTARTEFSALQAFAARVGHDQGIITPTPLCFDASVPAYLMTSCEGAPLSKAFHFSPITGHEVHRIATELNLGLDIYHDAVRGSYGDFHPDNILYERTTGHLCFLDPGWTNDLYPRIGRDLDASPWETDAGYWLFWSAGRLIAKPVTAFRRSAVIAQITACLLALAASRDDSTIDGTANVAQEYIRRFLDDPAWWPRLHAQLVSLEITLLVRAAHRLASENHPLLGSSHERRRRDITEH
jgi:hypothetical protein